MFTIFIRILIIRTDKSICFKSRLRHAKTVTHGKPIKKFKLKLENFLSTQPSSVFSKKFLFYHFQICAAPIHCKIYQLSCQNLVLTPRGMTQMPCTLTSDQSPSVSALGNKSRRRKPVYFLYLYYLIFLLDPELCNTAKWIFLNNIFFMTF